MEIPSLQSERRPEREAFAFRVAMVRLARLMTWAELDADARILIAVRDPVLSPPSRGRDVADRAVVLAWALSRGRLQLCWPADSIPWGAL